MEKSVTSPSGACLERIVQRRYSNYTVALAQAEERSTGNRPVSGLIAWPNPVAEQLNLRLPESVILNEGGIQIFSAAGNLYSTQMAIRGKDQIEIPVSELPAGVYWVRLLTHQGPANLKFVKQ